ncbi:hypothetical protein CEXT_487601 [Caerostris extrusa]|uniref:Uncharacterized protein n=1 Tax=Caerostris extrusa TaxID=172846 RepID=A0AAV4Q387_CAEEX|nr:hypothetical protein CEXT_487601 [Caerostris extrusa]
MSTRDIKYDTSYGINTLSQSNPSNDIKFSPSSGIHHVISNDIKTIHPAVRTNDIQSNYSLWSQYTLSNQIHPMVLTSHINQTILVVPKLSNPIHPVVPTNKSNQAILSYYQANQI